MLVTISGLPGSGTSTVAVAVARELGINRVDGGTEFRVLAAERGFSIEDFSVLAERDPSIDLALDERLAQRARADDIVLEARLAGWIAANEGLRAVRVWIECDEAERARRVAARDGLDLDTALAANRRREASEQRRYRAYYGIDLADRSVYDGVLDSGRSTPRQLVQQVVSLVRSTGW